MALRRPPWTPSTAVHIVPVAIAGRAASKRDLRIDSILDRAMELVEQHGLEALTLQRLAESLGLVTTGLYRYFPSKDALSAAVQRRAIQMIHQHFEARSRELERSWTASAPATAALAAILGAARIYLSLPRAQPRAWLFVAILLGDPRPLLSDEESAKAAPIMGAFLAGVAALFDRAAADGALAPGAAADRVPAFWAALHGAHCLEKARRLLPALPAAEVVGMQAARALLSSWGASSPRLAAAEKLLAETYGRRKKRGGA